MKTKTIMGIFIILILLSIASVTAQIPTHDYRKNLTISHVDTTGTMLVNNSYFLNITKEPVMDYRFNDLRFYDIALNELDYEREYYTDTYALIWLRLPTLETTGTTIWMYYNGYGEEVGEDPEDTWEPAAKMVQHLKESPINGFTGHLDSTRYNNHGTPCDFNETLGSTTNATGIIAGADLFNGFAGYPYLPCVQCGAGESTNITGNITLEAWVKAQLPEEPEEPQSIVGKYYPWGSRGGYHLYLNEGKFGAYFLDAHNHDHYMSFGTADTTTWQHVVVTKDSSYIRGYVDSIEKSNKSCNAGITSADTATSAYHVGIGRYAMASSAPFDGAIDEVRIYDRAFTADEIKQSYEMVTNQSVYATWGEPLNLQKCGDADCNGFVNVLDATKVKLRAGNPSYFIGNEWSADVNCDSTINVLDATKVKNHAGNPSYILDCCII